MVVNKTWKRSSRQRRTSQALVLAAVMAMGGALPAAAQWATQTIPLTPGWNAVFLEVQPEPDDSEVVFQGIPVASVWAWNKQFSTVQYIQDPNTLMPEQPEWLSFLPAGSPESFLTDLHIIEGGLPYLIKLSGDVPVNWTVTGTPIFRPPGWMADSFNLVGFSVMDGSQISFRDFFSPSSAQNGQKIHRLSASGAWMEVTSPASENVQRGKAYWVYSRGESDYAGLLSVDFEEGGSLDYGRSLVERTLQIRNARATAITATLRPEPSAPPVAGTALLAGPVPLSYYVIDAASKAIEWRALDSATAFPVPAASTLKIRIAVRRADMADFVPSPEDAEFAYQSLLSIEDGLGSVARAPVRALGLRSKNTLGKRTKTAGAGPATGKQDLETLFADVNAGLWQGYVAINAVNEPNSGADAVTPKPTASEFQFPLIIHVDNDGQARLLQEITVLWQDGTSRPDDTEPQYTVLDQPGRYVLVTREELLSQFKGAALRDGQQVGRRISSAALSHREPAELAGEFGDTLACELELPFDDPLNPFKHRYHPDHNMNVPRPTVRADGSQSEWYTVTRQITLEFSATDPEGVAPAGWGDSITGGTYRETMIGIHKELIHVEGLFRLNRIMHLGVLNDGIE